MKRLTVFLLSITLLLCGCRRAENNTEVPSVPGVDPESGQWTGRGGCWRLSPADIEYPENCMMSFLRGGERWFITLPVFEETRILCGEREFLRTADLILDADATDDALWYAWESRDDDGAVIVAVMKLSYEGEELATWETKLPHDCFPRGFVLAGDSLLLNCSDSLRIYSISGKYLHAIPHADWNGRLIRNGDNVYFNEPNNNGGGTVSRVSIQEGGLEELFSYPSGTICKGDGESAFFLMQSDGVYRLSDTGVETALVIWEECGLGVAGLTYVEAEPDGTFLVHGNSFNTLRLSPAEPQELKARTRLTLAAMGLNGSLSRAVAEFNARSTDCYVQMIDLTEGGLNSEDAILRLNTQLISGEGPDMLAFRNGRLSPFPLLRKGMLRDLKQDVNADPDIALDDLWTAVPIQRDCGGLYLMAADFSIETRLGLQDTFGEADGWSFDDYLRLSRATPEDHVVMYNLTRDYFLTEGASRFLRRAIDWQSGTCDFDNADFVRLLEATRDLKETPEDQQNLVFGDNLLADGYMATELTMLNHVTDLARYTRHIGKPTVVIGFPTPDGSCGTDMGIGAVGVLTSSRHPEACWAFLKDWLLHPSAIPAYQPLIEKELDKARSIEPAEGNAMFSDRLTTPISDGEIQQFYKLLSNIQHTTLSDETVLKIIREEAAPFLAGQRTPEETARKVQSRVSLYVSEQT